MTGVTTVSAHTTVSVGGVSLTRNTNGAGANSGAATKTWVNARISITPNATNEVGAPHTFTVTLEKDPGTGTFVAAAGEHVDVTLTDSNGAAHTAPTGTCTNAGANTDAAGQCTITFTSPTAGKVTGHATSTLSVNGSAPFTVETDGVAPNSRQRGEDVRGCEHPDHAAAGDQPGRDEPRPHRPRQRELR